MQPQLVTANNTMNQPDTKVIPTNMAGKRTGAITTANAETATGSIGGTAGLEASMVTTTGSGEMEATIAMIAKIAVEEAYTSALTRKRLT